MHLDDIKQLNDHAHILLDGLNPSDCEQLAIAFDAYAAEARAISKRWKANHRVASNAALVELVNTATFGD